jgi:hypothetical protein
MHSKAKDKDISFVTNFERFLTPSTKNFIAKKILLLFLHGFGINQFLPELRRLHNSKVGSKLFNAFSKKITDLWQLVISFI